MFNTNKNKGEVQGTDSIVTVKNFFDVTNVNPTDLINYYDPLSPKQKQKLSGFYNLLRNGFGIKGEVEARLDKDDIAYAWIVVELPRGVKEYKIILLSDAMLDLFINYQFAHITVRFTLEALIAEARELESKSSSSN
ncbi:hypothetical protein LJ707_16255 [Mucilaginibacter sp. UR6-1]|uniref:hypothetical protein n=1 Tax=Mucilaginibacter sp. UR6-1 TaxID=1435643 RepID=UPI001E43A60C|nr:hypothetical protein [Mucilaginibacter sp. UR6-1]MCC8410496.1 hypothetical protein [Mucilaginibacter sp. UR6-1]